MELAVTCAVLALCGLAIGLLSGLLGIGGGMIIIPLLRLGFGLEAHIATATSLFTIVFTSLSGTITHIRAKTCIPKLGIVLGIGGALTTTLGVHLASMSPAWAIMLAAGLIILYASINMLRKAMELPKANRKLAAFVPAETEVPEPEIGTKQLVLGFCIGLIAGLASGYVGVGGGFIMIPLMSIWLKLPMKKAAGTSLIAMLILSIPGAANQIMLENVDFLAGIMLAAGSIPGAYAGARLVKRAPERSLRLLFAGLLAVAAVFLVINELVLA